MQPSRQESSKRVVPEVLFPNFSHKKCAKYSLLVFLDSSNFVGKFCVSWVLSTSVWVARSPVDFCYATTEAERRPLVFSVPIPLRTQRARVPTRRKAFLRNYWNPKELTSFFLHKHKRCYLPYWVEAVSPLTVFGVAYHIPTSTPPRKHLLQL